jgi:Glycosyltransferase sugar-binding region containing DXD motif
MPFRLAYVCTSVEMWRRDRTARVLAIPANVGPLPPRPDTPMTGVDQLPIFAYWQDTDHTVIANTVEQWRAHFSQFRVLGNNDIDPLVCKYFPQYFDSYRAIRIPAAKADLARLLALYEWGGLYVDCHCGIKDPDALRSLLGRLSEFEAIFVDRRLSQKSRPSGAHFLINAILIARTGSQLFLTMAREALTNLDRQREIEREKGFVSYHIGRLSGPDLITAVVLQPGTHNCEIRRDLSDRVLIIPEETAPVERYSHGGYRVAGSHWFERQKTELLFMSVP